MTTTPQVKSTNIARTSKNEIKIETQHCSCNKLLKLEVYSAFVAASSFLCIGLLRAYTSPALVSMKKEVGLLNSTTLQEKDLISWIASTPPLASLLGTIISGPLLQYVGRQRTIVILTIPYIVGWILIGFANGIVMILLGRICTGFAAGLSTPASQLYISECVRANVRGMLGFLPPMMLALGVLIGFIGGTINIEWRQLAFVMGIFPIILLIMSFTIPESPGWFLLKNREMDAFKSLTSLRYGNEISIQNIQTEIDELKTILIATKKIQQRSSSSENRIKIFFSVLSQKEIWFPTIICIGLMIFQQFCGANCVIFYLTLIIEETLPPQDPTFVSTSNSYLYLNSHIGSLIVAGVQFIAFFVSLPLIDRLGRKVLLITSAILMTISQILMGLYFYFLKNSIWINEFSTWLPIVCLSVFIASYSIGFGPIPFLIMSEIFPSNVRSYLCSVGSFVNHFSLFIIIYMFPTLLVLGNPSYIFGGFGLFTFCSIIFIYFLVPETKGKTLGQIELEFSGRLVTKL